MKSVAFYGFSNMTRDLIHDSKADEIWSVNMVHEYNCPRVDRLFDMHPLWHLQSPGDRMQRHFKWLQQEHPFPIYMMERYDEIPSSVAYPVDEVVANIGIPYFTSSVSYMLGLAMLEGFDRIELYGLDMASETEYAYQKAGTEFLLGMAMGRGIKVYVPEKSLLLRAGLYGYDGGFQVIGRQTMEKIRHNYQEQFDQALAQFEQIKGEYNYCKKRAENAKTEADRERFEKDAKSAYQKFLAAQNMVRAVDVAVQVATHFIDEIDVKAPDLEIHDNVAVKVTE